MLAALSTGDSRVYLVLALASTLLFVLRMVLMMLGHTHDSGLDGMHTGLDMHTGDVSAHEAPGTPGSGGEHAGQHGDSDSSFQLFSLQSVVAFIMGFGWTGLACTEQWHLGRVATLGASAGFGLLMMMMAAALSFYMQKLNRAGWYDVRSCVGTDGRVYLTIPEKGKGFGQVEVSCSGRRKIIQAASTGAAISSFAMVKVVGVDDLERLIVEPAPLTSTAPTSPVRT